MALRQIPSDQSFMVDIERRPDPIWYSWFKSHGSGGGGGGPGGIATAPYNVKDFGAVGDGDLNGNGTDDTEAIQVAEDAVSAVGGGILFFPAGIYVISATIIKKDKISWMGAPGATVIIAKNGFDVPLVRHIDSLTHYTGFSIFGIIFDGNEANAPLAIARSVWEVSPIDSGIFSYCVFRNGSGYGCAFENNFPQWSSNVLFDRCAFLNNGIGGADRPGDTFDGLDIKQGSNFTFIGCVADGNHNTGFNPRGLNHSFINCEAKNNGTDGFLIQVYPTYPTSASIIGGSAHGNTDRGVRLQAGLSGDPQTRVSIENLDVYENDLGYFITDTGVGALGNFQIIGGNVHDNTNHGIVIGGSDKKVEIIGTRVESNGGSGVVTQSDAGNVRMVGVISTGNVAYGLREDAVTTTIDAIGCNFLGNGAGAQNTGPSNNQGSGSVLIKSGSGTVSNLDFVLAPYSSKYRALRIMLTDIHPSANDAKLLMRTSTNGGVSFDSGAGNYAWSWHAEFPGGVADGFSVADTSITTGIITGNNPVCGSEVEVILTNLTNGTVYQLVDISGVDLDSSILQSRVTASGVRFNAAVVNAVRFFMDSGSMTVKWALYGVL